MILNSIRQVINTIIAKILNQKLRLNCQWPTITFDYFASINI